MALLRSERIDRDSLAEHLLNVRQYAADTANASVIRPPGIPGWMNIGKTYQGYLNFDMFNEKAFSGSGDNADNEYITFGYSFNVNGKSGNSNADGDQYAAIVYHYLVGNIDENTELDLEVYDNNGYKAINILLNGENITMTSEYNFDSFPEDFEDLETEEEAEEEEKPKKTAKGRKLATSGRRKK